MENRYFTPNTDDPNLSDILDMCVEVALFPLLLDESKGVCKLPLGYKGLPECLRGVPEFNNKDMVLELDKAEWNEDI